MKHQTLSLEETGAFNGFFLDYISGKESLKPFYSRFPSPENFAAQAAEKSTAFDPEKRKRLHQALVRQYTGLEHTAASRSSLDALRNDNCFTIVTGHQLNLFTGPLYFIYKIVTAINACRDLNAKYPHLRFVPVYWMASEDHDIDEIRYFRLHSKKYVWDTPQQGAVGRFALKDLQALLKTIPGDLSPFLDAYRSSATLAEAVRKYVHALFGNEGLLVVDGDETELKRSFVPHMEADLFQGVASSCVSVTNAALQTAGYDPQVHVRDINLFYLGDGFRERIERQDRSFVVVNTDIRFDESALRKELDSHPDRFSPNVILRPLYQEAILPNVAYIGGPAENVYWLQLRELFNRSGVPFPVLLPRNFAAVLEAHVHRQFSKCGIPVAELFLAPQALANRITLRETEHRLDTGTEQAEVDRIFIALGERAAAIDPTLQKHIAAQAHRTLQALNGVSTKMLRAERRRQSDRIRQALGVREALFPGGGLQERTENVLNFYQTDRNFIRTLLQALDPFEFRFHLLMYE